MQVFETQQERPFVADHFHGLGQLAQHPHMSSTRNLSLQLTSLGGP